MSTSPNLAASTSMAFSGAVTSRPSIEKVTSRVWGRGIPLHHRRRGVDAGWVEHRAGAGVAAAVDLPQRGAEHVVLAAGLDVLLDLLAEVLDHRADRHRHRVAEHAQAVADDLLLDRGHDVEVHRRGVAVLDPLEHLHGPVRALAARGALATRLVAVELRGLQRRVDDRDRVVDDDDRA